MNVAAVNADEGVRQVGTVLSALEQLSTDSSKLVGENSPDELSVEEYRKTVERLRSARKAATTLKNAAEHLGKPELAQRAHAVGEKLANQINHIKDKAADAVVKEAKTDQPTSDSATQVPASQRVAPVPPPEPSASATSQQNTKMPDGSPLGKLLNDLNQDFAAIWKDGDYEENTLVAAVLPLSAPTAELSSLANHLGGYASIDKSAGENLRKLFESIQVSDIPDSGAVKLLQRQKIAYFQSAKVYGHVFMLESLTALRRYSEGVNRFSYTSDGKEIDRLFVKGGIAEKFNGVKSQTTIGSEKAVSLVDVEAAMVRALIHTQEDDGAWAYRDGIWMALPDEKRHTDSSLLQSAIFGIRTSLEHNGTLDELMFQTVFYGEFVEGRDLSEAEQIYEQFLAKGRDYVAGTGMTAGDGKVNYVPGKPGEANFVTAQLLCEIPPPHNAEKLTPAKVSILETLVEQTLNGYALVPAIAHAKFAEDKVEVDFIYHYQAFYTARALTMYVHWARRTGNANPDVEKNISDLYTAQLGNYTTLLELLKVDKSRVTHERDKKKHSFLQETPTAQEYANAMASIVAALLKHDLEALDTAKKTSSDGN
jgi:hypothetical protein